MRIERKIVMVKYCPKCDLLMEHQEDEPDVGIVGGWYCDHCDYSVLDDQSDD